MKTYSSPTAFGLNWLRSLNPSLSGDPYAALWAPVEIFEQHRSYYEELPPSKDKACYACLRNRYVLDLILAFEKKHAACSLVNLGAGMSSYSFLVKLETQCWEFDLPINIEHKERRARELINSGALPAKEVSFCGIDFNNPRDQGKLTQALTNLESPVFVLLEGVSPYLSKGSFWSLHRCLAEHLPSGSEVLYHLGIKNSYIQQKISAENESKKIKMKDMTFFGPEELHFPVPFQVLEYETYFHLRTRYTQETGLDAQDPSHFERFYRLKKT